VGEPLLLVRDVLDKQIYDANALKLGKVDGIRLLRRAGRPPRVLAIESSMPCALRRVWRPLGGWLARFQHWLAADVEGETVIQFTHVVRSGIDVEVDIDGKRTSAFVWETWLAHFVEMIPGGKGHGEKGE
jgi:hypothetical protein